MLAQCALVITLGEQSVADAPNKRLARIKEKLMPWRFAMIHNRGKTASAAGALTRCRPLHFLYLSIDRTIPIDGDGEFKKFLKFDLEEIHVTVNLIKATQKDETMLKILDHIRRGMPTQD